jgi:two-component system NtrC family sensor kinase
MPPEVKNRVFDPFFTTKPVGEGTGLGMSVCLGIVTAHEGRLSIESQTGRGTTVAVDLPACTRMAEPSRPPTTESQLLRLRQRILVVDDEEPVREVLTRVLSSFGFRVATVASAEEAMSFLAEEPVDMVICDLRMAGLGGQGLYYWVKDHAPHLEARMVFCTGDAAASGTREFLAQTTVRVVTKPFDMDSLAGTLAEIQQEMLEKACPAPDAGAKR